jgi:hypothetical protein
VADSAQKFWFCHLRQRINRSKSWRWWLSTICKQLRRCTAQSLDISNANKPLHDWINHKVAFITKMLSLAVIIWVFQSNKHKHFIVFFLQVPQYSFFLFSLYWCVTSINELTTETVFCVKTPNIMLTLLLAKRSPMPSMQTCNRPPWPDFRSCTGNSPPNSGPANERLR